MRSFLTLSFCLFLAACGSQSVRQIDLVRNLDLAEQEPDTSVISFGTRDAQDFLVSGWSSPEKERGNPFQWAVSREPSFSFSTSISNRPLYLYLVLKSFFSNPADVYVNDRYLSRIKVEDETARPFLPLPASLLNSEKNIVRLQFSDVRPALNGHDTRQLAAAAYLAVVTPSKYIGQSAPSSIQLIGPASVRLRHKVYPALAFQTGGKLNYYEKLNKRSVLKFGYHFRPAAFSEDDDYAVFRVTLRKDGERERQIFYRRLQDAADGFFSLPLYRYIANPDESIYRISFQIRRNSIFNDVQTSWIQPTLEVERDAAGDRLIAADFQKKLSELRRENRGANVVLIILDAAGAGHFGCYGYPRNTTPIADGLARENIQFQSAYSNAAYTLASTASLMSGFLPEHHRILSLHDKLPDSALTMPEVFRSAGYRTATFVANGNASSTFGMTQGFEKVFEVFREPDYSGWGKEITIRFNRWLQTSRGSRFFAYLHYREPHDPYNPPEKWVQKFVDPDYRRDIGRTFDSRIRIDTNNKSLSEPDRNQIKNLYDANLAYGDSQVGQVITALKQQGVYGNTILIVAADHGEAFWQHGYQGHNVQVYEESIHIPLIIKLKDGFSAGKKIPQRVRTIDVFPSLVDLLDLPSRGLRVDGRSFLPYIVSSGDEQREVISQTTRERQYVYRAGDLKYIEDVIYHVPELYDLRADPSERTNLFSTDSVRAGYYRSKLHYHLTTSRALAASKKAERAVIDEAARENLRALGYIDSDKQR